MKIEIESIDDLNQLVSVLSPTYLRAFNTGLETHVTPVDVDAAVAAVRQREYRERDIEGTRRLLEEGKISKEFATDKLAELGALPVDIAQPAEPRGDARLAAHVAVAADSAEPDATDELPERDADGAQYDTRWHSEPKKLTDKGVFRARRGRDNDAYKAWLLEQAVDVAEAAIASDEAEPVATETHALPQDSRDAGAEYAGEGGKPHPGFGHAEPGDTYEPASQDEPQAPGSNVDLEALIAASLEAAQDASDSHVDLLNACRDFTSKHGHPAFTALKAAVAPDDAGGGKAVQHFTPGERRLMQACIANYPSN